MRLAGKVALVTGASGGLGQAIAEELAREGADVAVHYRRRQEEAHAVADRITALGRVAVPVTGAVEDPAAVAAMIEHVIAEFGRLDLVVNNAGTTRNDQDPWADYDRIMAVNVRGPLLVSQAAYPHLKAARGVIVMVSSVSAFQADGLYDVSKAALNAMTRGLARSYAPEVRVVGVAPGFVAAGMNNRRPHIWDQVAERTPLKRNGTPWDIARAVAYLASADAGWVTGETLSVNGGLFLRP